MNDRPKLIEIDVCSGPTLTRAERLAFRPTPRPAPHPAAAARKEEPAAPPPARTDVPAAAE